MSNCKRNIDYILECFICGKEYNDSQRLMCKCEKCGGSLKIDYDYDKITQGINKEILESRKPGVWKYKELLPLRDTSKIVSLGEGGTKLHKCGRLANILGSRELYAKDETRNPTGTFKPKFDS